MNKRNLSGKGEQDALGVIENGKETQDGLEPNAEIEQPAQYPLWRTDGIDFAFSPLVERRINFCPLDMTLPS